MGGARGRCDAGRVDAGRGPWCKRDACTILKGYRGTRLSAIDAAYVTRSSFYVTLYCFYVTISGFYVTQNCFYVTRSGFYVTLNFFYVTRSCFYVTL